MTTLIFILIVFQHFLFDWILQPRWVAVNKSKNNVALGLHGLIVTAGYAIPAGFVYWQSFSFFVVATVSYGLLHIVQDRIVWAGFKPKTENPYQEKRFWNTVAVDQFIHLTVAVLLLWFSGKLN